MSSPSTPAAAGPPRPAEPRGLSYVARLWFGLRLPVKPRAYLLSGLLLMAVKYSLDAGAVYLTTSRLFAPLDYVNPLLSMRERSIGPTPDWLTWAMVVWTLPFLWVGLSMTVRRLADAGRSPWLGLLFFLPGLNYLLMLTLAVIGSSGKSGWPQADPQPVLDQKLRSALLGVAASVVIALSMVGISVFAFGSYGATLFFGTPFLMGAVSAFLYNRGHPRAAGGTIGVAALSVVLAGLAMLLFALEGVLCIAMAAPIALAMSILGALVGRAIASSTSSSPLSVGLVVLALPFVAGAESALETPPLREVVSVTVVDAPPAVVWEHVTKLSELPPPERWFFTTGIAYPLRARLEGEGVGAVRHCEFSTGAFVEPITAWVPGERLSFDVASQPPAMHEWSPYRHVHAPHLDGYLRSERGEFRLTALEGGGTRLEGSTWYRLSIYPASYWAVWSDSLIHAIHERVLAHVKRESEAAAAR